MKTPLFFLFALATWLPIAWADDANPMEMAADTNWYYHYNFEAANQSALAQEFKDEIDELFSRIEELNLVDLNPSEDLFSFTLYGNHLNKKTVAILKGNFSPSLFYAIKKMKPQKSYVNGYEVYQLKNHFATIHEERYILSANNKEHLASALNVINGLEPHLELENELLQTNTIASSAITDIDIAQKQLKKFDRSMMLSLPIEKVSYSLKDNGNSYTSNLKVLSTEKVGDSLAKLTKGYLGLVEAYVTNLPKVKELVESITVSQDEGLLTVQSTVDNSVIKPFLVDFLEKAKNYKSKKDQ